MITLKSNIDHSVNFVSENLDGFLESRYVRRSDKYFVCYLSSQNGCNRGCRFCHLTATKQTDFKDSTLEEYMEQARAVFSHYRKEQKAEAVHFSFMARGEALANKNLLSGADKILSTLADLAIEDNLFPKFNVSTIMPRILDIKLTQVFRKIHPTIYYSLYSVSKEFRNKWLPGALPYEEAFSMLKEYQYMTKKIQRIHFSFIEGENDSTEDMLQMIRAIKKEKLICDFNIVRYNPFSEEQGVESSEDVIARNVRILTNTFDGRVKVIQRVGFDVKASCGMFVTGGSNGTH